MTTEFGPCEPWGARFPCEITEEMIPITGTAVDFATDVVWALSGRQFGVCEVTLRPCRRDCQDTPWPSSVGEFGWAGQQWISPALVNGQWFNIVCGQCSGTCTCTSISEVVLPSPVAYIVEVKDDGEILPTGSYRVDNNRLLVRTDGADWPWCNDLNLGDDQPGTWSVTAGYGRLVPESGEWAVGELACELMKAMRGEDCRLPSNVQQLARQGVTISFPNVLENFQRGLTGLYLTDLFITSFNPNHLTNRSRTYNVDRPSVRRPSWP